MMKTSIRPPRLKKVKPQPGGNRVEAAKHKTRDQRYESLKPRPDEPMTPERYMAECRRAARKARA